MSDKPALENLLALLEQDTKPEPTTALERAALTWGYADLISC